MKELIIEYAVKLAFLIIAAIATKIIIPAIAAWLKSKTDNQNLITIIEDVENTVKTCVDNLEQTVVWEYKNDGTWDADTQKAVRDAAIENVMQNLLDLTKRTLEANEIDIRKFVEQHIEAYILSQK